jgi:ferredoxin
MQDTIYWFSGTGNSLYAAKKLAEIAGFALSPIKNGVPSQPVGGADCKIGFVFPSYYGDLPRIVRAFVEKLDILPETDLFVVVTMGAFGQGSIKAAAELLAEKGLSLRYGVGLRMPANYIIAYDPALLGAKSERCLDRKLNGTDKKILKIANDVADGKREIKENSLTAKTLYTNIPSLDAAFCSTEKCSSCGLCEKICPVENIKLMDGKPTWLHSCEHCVACINWCPGAAIEYGRATAKRTRYRNPRVRSAELCGNAKP